MPVGISFSKSRAEYLLDCLYQGKPIEGVRTVDDKLALAGACFFFGMIHKPVGGISGTGWAGLSPERQHAIQAQHLAELHSAIEFYSNLTLLVDGGVYDEKFEHTVKAVAGTSKGKTEIGPVQGFRGYRMPTP